MMTMSEPRISTRARVRLPPPALTVAGEPGKFRVRYVDDALTGGTALVPAHSPDEAVSAFRALHPDFRIVGGNLPTSADPKLCKLCGSAHAGWRGVGYGNTSTGHEFRAA